jgi:hypothetical protein
MGTSSLQQGTRRWGHRRYNTAVSKRSRGDNVFGADPAAQSPPESERSEMSFCRYAATISTTKE